MIEYRNIYLKFDEKQIFSDLTLKINRGDKVAILGRSGAGKSSLFALVLGFIHPDSGEVFFEGKVVDENSVWKVRRKTAYVDQDVSFTEGNILDWFGFASKLRSNASLNLKTERIYGLMDHFELERDLLKKNVTELSGGERQRFAIILAVLLDRKVFLLDEITSALDKELKKKTAAFFLKEKEWTVVSISHDPVWTASSDIKIFDLEKREWKR
jgi:putative ABC transport system ATP-binding protein